MINKQKTAALTLAAAVLLGSFSGSAHAASSTSAAAAADSVLRNKPLYEVYTAAGTGASELTNGKPAAAAFREPTSLLYDSGADAFLVADSRNQNLRVVTPSQTATAAGIYIGDDELNSPMGSLLDGSAAEAAFNRPSGLAEDASGAVYVADAENNAIRKITNEGKVITIAGNGVMGSADGSGEAARFYHPLDVAVSGDGVIYVADTLNHVIRQIKAGKVTTLNAASTRIVEYFPGVVEGVGDYADGPLSQAKFNEPSGLALDAKGNLYVSDTGNNRIRYIDFKTQTVTTVAGGVTGTAVSYETNDPYSAGGYADGHAASAKFQTPRGLVVTPEGGVLIADSLNHVIRYLYKGMVSTIAGTPGEEGRTSGVAGSATLNRPTDVALMEHGAFAIADAGSNTIRVVIPYTVPEQLKADGRIHLLYHQNVLDANVAPTIKAGTTFVPLRVLTEKLGFKVNYAGGSAVLEQNGVSYTVKSGSAQIVKKLPSGATETLTLRSATFTSDSRLFLPVRFFAEELGLDVQWLSDTRAVLLRDKKF
ncbi:stalk domain-containing protein [Paenibacillus lignilyticus]|uniref:Copper amine oxidase n=1 Tax=Paenibacillus lignilyticus TaxID=1172615 RepID=A0ABS5C5Q5_9BACL|nr:stalk domain-containing protein [Paenibacillus lignilyticus]MBP3961328.1 copper amine oxidase [Paenibacillus lignilyticus]